MKKINLISRLLSYSHEKQTPRRFGRYAVMLLLLLTCAAHAWADCAGDGNNIAFNNCHFYFNPYYDETHSVNKGYIQLAVRKYQYDNCDPWGWYTGVTTLNNVTNTRLYYASTLEGTAWTDDYKKFHGWAMISNSTSKSNAGDEWWNSSTWASDFKAYGLNSNNTYLFQASSSSSGQTIETTTAPGYLSSGWSALNKTITVKAKISINNGSTYSEATSPAVLTASSNKFTAHNTCTTATSLSSGSIVCGYTATTTLTAPSTDPTGYTWVGWYNSSGTQQTTGKTLTIYPTANATYYAYYTANQYDGYIDANGGAADKAYTATYGVGTLTIASAPTRTGYQLNGYYEEDACTHLIANTSKTLQNSTTYTNSSGKWNYTSAPDLFAGWTANTYYVKFNGNGSDGGSMSNQTLHFDASETLNTCTFTKTGYNFAGWAASADGSVAHVDGATKTFNLSTTQGATVNLYAKWTARSCTVNFDFDESDAGYGSKTGATTSVTATYDAAMTSVTPPTAKNGYAFMGYFDDEDGDGTQYYTSTGTSAHTWDKDTEDDVDLYAYYKKAEITNIAFGAGAVVENGSTVNVTATISPTPTGTTTVCWRILYDNESALDPQPGFTPVNAQGNSVNFTAPAASGMYKVEAVLHTGSGCAGTELSTYVADFQVAGSHTVTVQYHDGSGNSIKTSTSVTGRPLDWSSGITAPDDIFGYIFEYWKAGDGITLSKDGSATHGYDTARVSTVYIKATYDGTLTAVYKPADILYFKNTMGWSNVYVYFYTSDKYWDNITYGSGTWKDKQFCEKKKDDKGEEYDDCTKPYWDQKHGQLERLGSTDIWYIDFGALGCADWHHIVFNANQQDSYEWFSATELVRRGDLSKGTPMFVPADKSTYDPTTKNSNAKYYNQGYWTKYLGNKTGYTLEVYNAAGNSLLKEIPFTGDQNMMPMTATADLEGNTNYKFQIRRDNSIYYGNGGTMNYANHGQGTPWAFTNGSPFPGLCTIQATAAGDYVFHLTYSQNALKEYELRIGVDYPISDGDYRLVYSDAVQTKELKSAIIPQIANKDTIVSFFIRIEQSPNLRMQKATVNPSTGAITWNEYPTSGTPVNQLTSAVLSTLEQDSVYNINLSMNGSSALSVTSVTPYEGNFYIRTDGVHNKWDDFRAPDHLMTYSEYAEKNSGFTHYFMSHVYGGTSVKFVVANDYAPNISDTLVQQANDASHVTSSGNLWTNEGAEANIRFMWNRHDNSVSRAYLAAAKSDGSEFLVLRANSATDLMDEEGHALLHDADSGDEGYNHKAPNNCIQFIDDENWIYETTVKVKPSAYVKLYATYHGETFYFKGENNNTFDKDNAIQILGGSGDAEKLHVVYDFKTGRLVAAWLPSGTIEGERKIYADVMFIREHQGDIEQLTFGENGKISEINTAYAVMRFNKWTLNNKSKADGHAVLDPLLSNFERDLFYISFPFRVNLEEVFGFGTYGTHWIIEEYDGAGRAEKGFWADSPTFWKFVTNRKGKFLEPNIGYILALDLDELGESSSVWDNGVEKVELFFPSYGTMPNITSSSVTHEVPAHTCAIGPRFEGGDDRRIKDSHWNVMSVPTYINTNNVSFANTTWITAGDGRLGPNFLYTWNKADNSLTPTAGAGYTYHAMHAYIVQYSGNVTWTTSVSPSLAPRRNPEAPKDVEYRLELSQNDKMVDQTFVRLSDDENVTAGFDFNYDLSKEFNKNKANIYTMVSTMIDGDLSITETAGNTLPMSEQKTIIPVGVKIAADGDYTFAIPDGTEGIGVTLIDNETGIRTSLSALDYTINLSAGTYDERFVLEISPIQQMPTGVEEVTGYGLQVTGARKLMIDGLLYIVKDGKMFDAQGRQVK